MADLEVTSETTVTIKLSQRYADKLEASISRALEATSKLDERRYINLVNTGTVDDLLALRTALRHVREVWDDAHPAS